MRTGKLGEGELDFGFGQPQAIPEGEALWNIKPEQQPDVVHTVEEFLEIVLFQPHLDRVVVFPDGVRKLGQEEGIPEAVRQAACSSRDVRGFLAALGPESQEAFRGRLWHYGKKGSEKELKKKPDKRKSLTENIQQLKEKEESNEVPSGAPLYVSELRWREKVKHPITSDLVKTATNCDIYDCTPVAKRMPLWERSEGGIFIGERGAGSGMHVDQCLWSNVGRNWCGFKLFALWPWSERHDILDDAGKGAVFHLPLTSREAEFLARAKSIALVGPGDVWVFSGGQPHTALVVGDGLNISAYESFVPAHPAAVDLLVRSNTKLAHWKPCWMEDDDLDELYEDVVDNLQGALRDPALESRLRSRLESCAEVMRKEGDSYCKELWKQEDNGERRRRREQDDLEERSSQLSSSRSPSWEPAAKKAKSKESAGA